MKTIGEHIVNNFNKDAEDMKNLYTWYRQYKSNEPTPPHSLLCSGETIIRNVLQFNPRFRYLIKSYRYKKDTLILEYNIDINGMENYLPKAELIEPMKIEFIFEEELITIQVTDTSTPYRLTQMAWKTERRGDKFLSKQETEGILRGLISKLTLKRQE